MIERALLLMVLLFHLPQRLVAQATDSAAAKVPLIKISGAADTYYGFDFSQPKDRNRQFTTQAYRHNEFNLNHGFLQGNYATYRTRATFAVHTGTYVQANYAAEPNELTKLIMEANAGIRI